MRILMIEDEPLLAEAVATYLKQWHAVDWMQRLEDGDDALRTVEYGMLLLDLTLPDGRGLDLLQRVRAEGNRVPVIILTAQDQVRDRIAGLNAGADDYLVKPFDIGELGARIQALQRRATATISPRLEVGALAVDQAAHKVWSNGTEIALTAREWAIFDCLLHKLGTTVPKARLEEALFSFGSEVESNAVEVYVSRLRKKLGSNVIPTLRGLGYRMDH